MYTQQPNPKSFSWRLLRIWQTLQTRRGLLTGVILLGALLAFELFNFTTTDYALTDLLGEVTFFGLRWTTILAIAFCGMDFAGVARLFTPEKGVEQGHRNKTEVWYLLGAWFLAAGMNALLTWWGVSLALLNHQHLGNEILSRDELLTVVPVFVAALVVLIRVLIIGTFSVAGNRLFSQAEESASARPVQSAPAQRAAPRPAMRPPMPDDWNNDFDQRPVEPRRTAPPVAARPVAPPPIVAQPVRPAPKPAPRPAPAHVERGGDTNGRNQFEAP
jgi:hypothetical protein